MARTRHARGILRPPALDDYGLLAALRSHGEPYADRLGIPVSIVGEDIKPRPPIVVETTLFRIAQEALNNAANHAQAGRVEINLQHNDRLIHLIIADDGCGFDSSRSDSRQSGWGLKTMRERAQSIGARLNIESAPGKGTRITVSVPREAA